MYEMGKVSHSPEVKVIPQSGWHLAAKWALLSGQVSPQMRQEHPKKEDILPMKLSYFPKKEDILPYELAQSPKRGYIYFAGQLCSIPQFVQF